MIYLYAPGIVGLNEVNVIDLSEVDDSIIDYTEPRLQIKLRDPDYIDDITSPYKIILRRSINDRIRTYVTYNNAGKDNITLSLDFNGLTTNRMKALKHFLLSTQGKSIGYKNPDGKYYSCTILNPDLAITTELPGTFFDNDGEEIVSELGTVSIQLMLIKEA